MEKAILESDAALQKHLNALHAEGAIVETTGTTVGCIDERVHDPEGEEAVCSCFSGNAGTYILGVDEGGKPMVLSAAERAKRIMESPDVRDSSGPIVITIHGEGDECGAAGIAYRMITRKSQDECKPGEVAEFDKEQGKLLEEELGKLTNRPVILKDVKTADCPKAHPATTIYVTHLAPNRSFNRNDPRLPQGMDISRGMFEDDKTGAADFKLNLTTAIEILIGPHGSGHDPIMVVVLTDSPDTLQQLQEEVNAIVKALPVKKNDKGETIRIIARGACLKMKQN